MKKLVSQNSRGFTLIEVIVVAAIIAILAGILVPMIFNQIDESKKTRAAGDVKSLQQAVVAVRTNTLRWPTWSVKSGACLEDVGYLVYDAGMLPSFPTYSPDGTAVKMYDVLGQPKSTDPIDTTKIYGCYTKIDNPNVSVWSGPYLPSESGIDPWGKSYLIALHYLKSTATAPNKGWGWVLSAGPDGKLDTDPNDPATTQVAGDDIGIRIQE